MFRWSRARPAALCLLVLLAAGLVVAPPVTGAVAQTDDTGFDGGETVFRVELDASGDAHWQVTERLALNDSTDEVAFAEVAEEFEAGAVDLDSVAALRAAVDAVDARTNRSMSVTDRDRTTTVEGDGANLTGSLTVSFTWENFARTGTGSDGDELLYVDDVLETAQGLWLPGLTADQQLVVVPPDGYGVLDAAVSPENGELHWDGPASFDAETLAVTVVGNGAGETDNNGTDAGPGETGDDGSGDGGVLSLGGLALVGLLLVVLAAAAIAAVRSRGGLDGDTDTGPGGGPTDTDGGTAPAADTDDRTDSGAATGGPGTPVPDGDVGTTAASGEETAVAGDGPAGTATIDEALLSDEERVERLLERNGGRMRQANIVDETGWSNAKVSQLLSAMEEEGRIDKLRIGRENLISFPDVDVTEFDDNV